MKKLCLEARFDDYVATFSHCSPDVREIIKLKADHSKRVSAEILDIAKSLDLSLLELATAEACGLFHDIGRFEQYSRFSTLSDKASLDHAALGVAILKSHRMLDNFDIKSRDRILFAIAYHNRASLPINESGMHIQMARMLRDADKLDILRICVDLYQKKHTLAPVAFDLGFVDTPGVSEKVCTALLSKRMVEARDRKNLNDYKLFQMGWIFDVNFKRSFELIKERGCLRSIYDTLPRTKTIDAIFVLLRSHIDTCLRQASECVSARNLAP